MKEHESWEGFQSYATLHQWDEIEPSDRPHDEEADRIVAHLPEWFDIRRELAPVFGSLFRLICFDDPETPGTTEARVVSNLQRLINNARSVQAFPTGAVIQRVKQYCESAEP